MDTELGHAQEFWMDVLTTVSTKSGTPVTELKKMDTFDFFALLSVIEKREKNGTK